MLITDEELKIRFTYHPPKEGQPDVFAFVRLKALELAIVINDVSVPCYERDEALKKIEEAVMWVNAGIARRGK